MLNELIKKNRSYRRFKQDHAVSEVTLRELVELARLSPCAANLQPLKFILSTEPPKNETIFKHLAWAGYLVDWAGPAEGEKPAAYIVILQDGSLSNLKGCDHGIAAQSILLGAVEKGLGGCMLGSISRPELKEALGISEQYEILLVIALGEPAEEVVLETCKAADDIRYWRDKNGVHHVPKRSLDELILKV